ncbi:hypothetical protein VTN00DRAFT_6525 [Thermoascus crustaceus]|uniref:uncharacterized protein n=1 Tax=Thermoascus crustaceus TaxID=5088 RepID=UPI0037446172
MIRVLGCDHGSTFVEITDGQATTKLKHLSDDPFGEDDLAEVTEACCHQEIKQVVVLPGPSKAAFLLADGSLLTLDNRDDHEGDGRRVVVTRHWPRNQARAILHIAVKSVAMHNPALVSGAVAIVPRADPKTEEKPQEKTNPFRIYTATFSSPITKLTSEFAVLTADGKVFTWGKELPADQQPPPPPDEDEEGIDEAWDEFVLFGKPIVKWSSRAPRRLDYTPRKLPLPVPIETLSTGAC